MICIRVHLCYSKGFTSHIQCYGDTCDEWPHATNAKQLIIVCIQIFWTPQIHALLSVDDLTVIGNKLEQKNWDQSCSKYSKQMICIKYKATSE